jgi:hypothetical protein
MMSCERSQLSETPIKSFLRPCGLQCIGSSARRGALRIAVARPKMKRCYDVMQHHLENFSQNFFGHYK